MFGQSIQALSTLLWGRGTIAFTLLCGLYLTVGTGFLPLFRLNTILQKTVGALFLPLSPRKRRQKESGQSRPDQKHSRRANGCSPWAALTTALGGTMGVGNIVGVGAALMLGGPGSLFWMWVGALLGMATKYSEVLLAVRFQTQDPTSRAYRGGPMYYISRGISGTFGAFLAALYCAVCSISSLSSGSMTQTNAIAGALWESFSLPPWLCALVLTLLCAWVLRGGCDRAIQTCSALVPLMSVLYLAGCGVVLVHFRQNIPDAFAQIFRQALSPASALSGGSVGFATALRVGIARGIFTHEAGLGSASIAHACSAAKSPVEQGFWGIFEVFCDTILVCTVTALVILASGVPLSPSSAQQAFVLVMGDAGGQVLAAAVSLFAFASVISFCLYGQRCIEYLFPHRPRALRLYQLLFLAGGAAGCFARLPVVFALADLCNVCLLIPNLVALLILSPQVFQLTRDYFAKGGNPLCSSARSNQRPCSKSSC